MADSFFEVIKRIGIFMVIGQSLLHFAPSAVYARYLKLLIRLMVIVQLAVPLLSLGSFDAGRAMQEAESFYREALTGLERQAGQEAFEKELAGSEEEKRMSELLEEKLEPYALAQGYHIEKAEIRYGKADEDGIRRAEKICLQVSKIDREGRIVISPVGEGKENRQLRTVLAQALEMEERDLEVAEIGG